MSALPPALQEHLTQPVPLVVAAWENARDHLRSQPGYLDTVLHRAITPDAEFQFVNVARWRTAEDFTAAAQSPGFGESAAGLARYRPHPALYYSRGFPQRGRSVAFCDVWWAGFGYTVSPPSGCLGSGCGGEEPRAVVMPSGEGLVASPAG